MANFYLQLERLILFSLLIIFISLADFKLCRAVGDSYTEEEKIALEQFRELVQDGISEPHQSENKYLIRFLRAKKFDLLAAEEFIRQDFAWRKEHKMQNILNEDWDTYKRDYPFGFTFDREGRPALTSRLGQINVRKLILNGQRERIRRYITYGFEKTIQKIHQVSNETGVEWIEGHLLFNMAGYNIRTHSCIQCVSGWINLVNNYENHFPQLAKTIVVVNTPQIFETLYQVLKPFTSPHSQKGIQLFGYDNEEWKRNLLKIYSEDKLPPEFGGTYNRL